MKLGRVSLQVVAAISLLLVAACTRTRYSAGDPGFAARAHPLQGSWEGVLAGSEGMGKYKMTIAGNTLHFRGLSTNEWYETTFTLPAGTAPQQLHATITGCPRRHDIGTKVAAIFKVEDGVLTLIAGDGGAKDLPKTIDGDKSTNSGSLDFAGIASNDSKAAEEAPGYRYIFRKAQPLSGN